MKVASVLSILSLVCGPIMAFSFGGSTTVGPGNPAAIFCENLGGQVIRVTETAGNQKSLCSFGTAFVEVWTLYKELKNKKPQQALQVYAESTAKFEAPNASSVAAYCEQHFGTTEVVQSQDRAEIGLCRFADGSSIEAWTLWNGQSSPKNHRLNSALK